MTDKEKLLKLRKLANAMYYAAQYLTTDASKLHKAMDEYHQFIINEYHKEEPTIPDIVDEHWWEMLGEEPVSEDLEEAAIQFATDTETGKVDVVKQSSFFWGAIYHKQQMMKKAVKWIKEVDSHNYIMRYCDSCEPTVNELIEWFDNFMEDEQ